MTTTSTNRLDQIADRQRTSRVVDILFAGNALATLPAFLEDSLALDRAYIPALMTSGDGNAAQAVVDRFLAGVLLEDDGEPVGGSWNYDADNRESPPKGARTLGVDEQRHPAALPRVKPDERLLEADRGGRP